MLDVRAMHAGYESVPVLRDVNLSVGRGESVALVGPNGAGKSTLVRAVCGLIPLTAGSIVMGGQDITAMPAHQRGRRGIAAVLENRRLFGPLTVRENVLLAEKMGRARIMAKPLFDWGSVIELFPIIEEKKNVAVELLSGGQQQMVAIARALLLQPEVLILDEPSTGLAPKIVEDILTIIGKLRTSGLSLLTAEQDVNIATSIADRGYVLSLGRVAHEMAGEEWRRIKTDERLSAAYLHGS
jgi:ABC-type branched-subunit amino acid transport system ATPase component